MNNYFVCNCKGSKTLYATINRGSRYNPTTTRHIIKPMVNVGGEWLVKDGATPIVLVYGNLKGFTANVTDDEIWEVIPNDISQSAREKDFKELRNYFDKPNSSDVECWHVCGETVMTNRLWTPYDKIPSGF